MWCAENGCQPASGPTSDVANFLAELHKQRGYQSSSLNAFRSAISSVHDHAGRRCYDREAPHDMLSAQGSFQCQITPAMLYSHLEHVDCLTLLGELGTLPISVTQASHLQDDNAIGINQAILLCRLDFSADRPSTV